MVSQLKKSNRDLKLEVQEKDRLIEQLRRNIKMSKYQEIEIEMTVYIDECLRLRHQLEQVLTEKNILMQQQAMNMVDNGVGSQRNYEDIANLEEAFKYQEMELQKERENASSMHMQLIKLQEHSGKLKDKQDNNKKKLRDLKSVTHANKRQTALLDLKTRECGALKDQAMEFQRKLQEKEKVYNQNRDLVTKNCSQSSAIDRLKREAQDKDRKVEELANEVTKLRMQQNQYRAPGQGGGYSAPPRRPSRDGGKGSQRATPIHTKAAKAPEAPKQLNSDIPAKAPQARSQERKQAQADRDSGDKKAPSPQVQAAKAASIGSKASEGSRRPEDSLQKVSQKGQILEATKEDEDKDDEQKENQNSKNLQSAQAESGADKDNGQDESGYNEKFEDDGEGKGLDEDGQVEQDENTNRERGLSASPAQKNIGSKVDEAHE